MVITNWSFSCSIDHFINTATILDFYFKVLLNFDEVALISIIIFFFNISVFLCVIRLKRNLNAFSINFFRKYINNILQFIFGISWWHKLKILFWYRPPYLYVWPEVKCTKRPIIRLRVDSIFNFLSYVFSFYKSG